jgi:8-oxo-dGTP diphosphatase
VPPDDEELLPGNVGGAVRIGGTVHRATGPWTPAVHALLHHLATRVPHVPRVHGFDEQGREVLDFMPGHVVDVDTEVLSAAQLVALVEWTRGLHEAVVDFSHPGPWRLLDVPGATLVGHNDLGAYNVCFDGDHLAGVFD